MLNFSYDDTEEDCSPLKGIKQCYDFTFPGEPGVVCMRNWPCTCIYCMDFLFDECDGMDTVGKWINRSLETEGILHPKGISPPSASTTQIVEGENQYVVEEIVAMRKFQGILQYKIKWLGYDHSFDEWKLPGDLHCDDLIEEFLSKI